MKERKERIRLTDTLFSAVVKLADGNPGALSALAGIIKSAETTDPDSGLGSLAPLLDFDRMGIYGSRIWMFYKDLCRCDPTTALAYLRWVQLGIGSESDLQANIDNPPSDPIPVVALVRQRLPRFAASTSVAAEAAQ